MRIIFLGTGGSLPTPQRNVSAVAVQMGSDILLFDCGEGTQRQFMLSSASFMKVSDIFISHLHGDHFLGIPAMLQSMSFGGRTREIRVHGPAGTIETVRAMLSLGYFSPGFNVLAGDLGPGDEVVFAGFRVRAVEADHTVPALCYVLEEDPRPGKFNPARAKELGVPEGPSFRVLQEGGKVQVGGQEILPELVMGPKRRGRKLFISGDTRPHARLVEAASGADLMIQEATLLSDLENEAREYGHCTAQQAGRAAAQAKAKLLYLYHFSNRYEDVSALVEEARKEFPNTFAAEDLLSLQVNPPEEEWNRANKD